MIFEKLKLAQDEIDLYDLFGKVNQNHFDGKLQINEVIWGIPNMVIRDLVSGVPAAALYPSRRIIVVHHALPSMRAPLYVYTYLLYHEGLHLLVPPENGDPHCPRFRKRELFAPHRKKSLEWLRRHKFPVMDG
jgi:hypothetical protein